MLTILIIFPLIGFISFLSIFIFLFLGKYNEDGLDDETHINEQPRGIYLKRSVRMNLWEVFIHALHGQIEYVPILSLFISLNLFFIFLLIYIIQTQPMDDIELYILYVALASVPFTSLRIIWNAYRKRSLS